MPSTITFADLGDIITSLGVASTWLWNRFYDFLSMLTENSLLFWFIVTGLVFSSIGIVYSVVKKLGVRPRRR